MRIWELVDGQNIELTEHYSGTGNLGSSGKRCARSTQGSQNDNDQERNNNIQEQHPKVSRRSR